MFYINIQQHKIMNILGGDKIRVIKKDIHGNDIQQETNNFENFGETIELSKNTQEEEKEDNNDLEYFMFIKTFENEFLKNIPVYLQSDYNIQKEIKHKAKTFYNIRKNGENMTAFTKKYNKDYNSISDKIIKGKLEFFKWLYPVVLDEKILYSLDIVEDIEVKGIIKKKNKTSKARLWRSITRYNR